MTAEAKNVKFKLERKTGEKDIPGDKADAQVAMFRH